MYLLRVSTNDRIKLIFLPYLNQNKMEETIQVINAAVEMSANTDKNRSTIVRSMDDTVPKIAPSNMARKST